ncbi:hypothetical protein M3O57_20405 [Xanthomonas nasturtii]|uniref:Uncharacterized protein n=1 Tax=Xanthomonas nasturtii TaxID=1843581 RepID=A0ABT0LVX3_9XANT|nr:hypothetical protein [Xanthomonas nasturtii]MCL1521530.1 hypothetical protein [Xanthomonas nasturtii]MCL1535713.1 hypothetical protein [Xanthomonas nasturtii]MCL1542663.1 hypothetical protein [Xanthomonas nasturtii]MCL1553489.1 hypothetical protein [Xanthomonas nasturtii]
MDCRLRQHADLRRRKLADCRLWKHPDGAKR